MAAVNSNQTRLIGMQSFEQLYLWRWHVYLKFSRHSTIMLFLLANFLPLLHSAGIVVKGQVFRIRRRQIIKNRKKSEQEFRFQKVPLGRGNVVYKFKQFLSSGTYDRNEFPGTFVTEQISEKPFVCIFTIIFYIYCGRVCVYIYIYQYACIGRPLLFVVYVLFYC